MENSATDEDTGWRKKKGKTNSEGVTIEGKRPHRRLKMIGAAAAVAGPPVTFKILANRLRKKPDREAGENIREPLGETAHYLEREDGARLYVEELGKGPTMILVHGWFCNTDSWHYQKKNLQDCYRVISYDQRGHRWSESADGKPVTIDNLAEDLKAIIDAKAPDEPVVLVGHSMGGMSILKLTETYPELLGDRVKGVALVDTSHVKLTSCLAGGSVISKIEKPVVEPLFRWITEHHWFADRVKRTMVGTAPFLVATRYLGYGSNAPLTMLEYISDMASETSMKGAMQAGLALLGDSAEVSLDPLRESGIPVMIWVGEKDKLTRPEVSEAMARELPGSMLYVVEDTGHPSYMEEYKRFNEVLDSFARESFGIPVEEEAEAAE
jgi:pimeloyl-ACP methyl ester carboxylesterase